MFGTLVYWPSEVVKHWLIVHDQNVILMSPLVPKLQTQTSIFSYYITINFSCKGLCKFMVQLQSHRPEERGLARKPAFPLNLANEPLMTHSAVTLETSTPGKQRTHSDIDTFMSVM